MSVSILASLRPLTGQCMRQSRIGLLYVNVKFHSSKFNNRAVVELPPQRRRLHSDTREHDARPRDARTPPPPRRRLTFRQFIGRLLTVSFRNARNAPDSKKGIALAIRTFFRKHPILYGCYIVLTIFTVALFANQTYLFYKLFYNSEVSRFPEPVATSLRRAIYYTSVSPAPERALNNYRTAMAQARLAGMDPKSEEVLGIRIMVSFWLEKQLNWEQSIDVLEAVRGDCLMWVGEIEQDAKDGKIAEDGKLKPEFTKMDISTQESTERAPELAPTADKSKVNNETLWARRERLLRRAVEISVKLGEVYASQHILEPDASHDRLVWAVETTLKEFNRRHKEKPRPGEEKWMTPLEMGASLESLGRDYERRGEFHLSIPLFFQALRNCDDPCHRAVIMNNLAACFAQHPIYSPVGGGDPTTLSLKEVFDSSMPNTRKDCQEAAANWAKNAYLHAKDVKGDDRTPECDEACAVALCNWGDVAAMQGKAELARKKYIQGVELSNKLAFKEGVKQAQEGLKGLDDPKKP